MAPPPDEGAPRRKKDGKPKFKQDQGEEPIPEAMPPPPPPGGAAPPPPPNVEDQPNGQRQGKANKRKGKDKEDGGPQQSCPEGTVPLEDGSCETPQ
jgi:hypothetical protein